MKRRTAIQSPRVAPLTLSLEGFFSSRDAASAAKISTANTTHAAAITALYWFELAAQLFEQRIAAQKATE